jgi:hypothetical protein
MSNRLSNRVEVFLRVLGGELFLGEAELRQCGDGFSGEEPLIVLKVCEDLGPQPSGHAGRQYVAPLQSFTELLNEKEG